MDRESHGTDGQNPTGYSPWGHRESDAIEHAHTKASGMGGWALLPWGGKGVRNSSHLSPSVLLQQGEALGADPTHRMTPDSDRCGFGILGTEVNSCVTYSMRLSAIFFSYYFFILSTVFIAWYYFYFIRVMEMESWKLRKSV